MTHDTMPNQDADQATEPTCPHGTYPDACGEPACMIAQRVGLEDQVGRAVRVTSNAAGCLPDTEPNTFPTVQDALEWIVEDILEAVDGARTEELHPHAQRLAFVDELAAEENTTRTVALERLASEAADILAEDGAIAGPYAGTLYRYTLEACANEDA